MKKVLLFIVCFTALMFTSCSKDEEVEDYNTSIVGTWYFDGATKNGEPFTPTILACPLQFTENGKCNIVGGGILNYILEDKHLLMYYSQRYRKGSDAEIAAVKEEMKTARGSYREYLIDKLNDLMTYETYEFKLELDVVKLTKNKLVLSSKDDKTILLNYIK